MADILQTTYSFFSWMKSLELQIRLHCGLIYNKSALVQVMDWRLTGAKPLPEPRLTKTSDVIWRHQANATGQLCYGPGCSSSYDTTLQNMSEN